MRAHGFRVYFTPLSAVLFTFPSRYLCAIGLPGVLSLGGWCRRIRTGLLRPRPTQGPGWVGASFAYGAVTLFGAPFQASSATVASSVSPALQPRPRLDADGLGWPPFARRYSGGHSCFPFLRLLGCFGSSGSPPRFADAAPARGGLPHSDTRGSRAARASPRSFAACRVLLRLREPRHPPYALARFSLCESCPVASTHRTARLVIVCCLCVCFHFPILSKNRACSRHASVENVGLEPTTPGLQSRCSSQLSQSPADLRVVPGRLELPTPTLSVWCSNRLSYGTPSPAPRGRALAVLRVSPLVSLSGQHRNLSPELFHLGDPPERRCSSRTFRYGYLVTT